MTNLQQPLIPVLQNPIEIDRAIVELNDHFANSIGWITHAYGKIYKNIDEKEQRRSYYPELYLGGPHDKYFSVSPDNDKKGQCFFMVTRENIEDYQFGQYAFLNYDLSIIFSVNLKLINDSLLNTDYFVQNCIAEVRNSISRSFVGSFFQISINTIDYLFEDIFREFNLLSQKNLEKSPLAHFRVNCSVRMQEECIEFAPVPVLPDGNVLVHLDAAKGVNNTTPQDGDLVSIIIDQSGNNNHFEQQTVSLQPTYRDLGINSLPSISYNGSYLFNTNIGINPTSDYSIFIICEKLAPPTGSFLIGTVLAAFTASISTTLFGYLRLSENLINPNFYTLDSNFNDLDLTLTSNAIGVPTLIGIVKSGSNFKIYGNNTLLFDITTTVSGSGTFFSLGSFGNGNFTGYISELAIYSEGTSTPKTQEVLDYFTTKYAL